MRKGLVIIGVILLVIGLLMMLFLWPMVGTLDEDDAAEKVAKGEKGTYTVLIDISDEEYEGIKLMKGTSLDPEGIYDNVDGPGTYAQRFEVTDDEVKLSKLEKVPMIGGILGLILLIVGIILLIVGFVTGKAAALAPEQPPMEQPYQQPYQEPYQQPPPQQPPMPPQ